MIAKRRLVAVVLLASALAGGAALGEERGGIGGIIGNLFSNDPPPPVPVAPAAPPAPMDGAPGRVPQSRAEISLTFAPLVKATAPAVVNVYAARAEPTRRSPFADDPFFGRFFGDRFEQRPRMAASLGSGVIVDPSGLVVTNNHVVEDADTVKIAFGDGREMETEILLKDAKVDLAVLRIKGDGPFPALQLADSDRLEIGDLVLAIGNPFGIGQTVTNGIVSALARTHIGVDDFGFFIQTDAAINPGNSGGALIDMAGKLAGINTAIYSRSGGSNGIGFAIPSNMVASFVRAAKAGGRFERPFVGASFGSVTPDMAEALGLDRPTGVIVHGVTASGPAAKAGLEIGDVVLSLGGFPVDNPDVLDYRLAAAGVGSSAPLEVLRGSQKRTLQLSLLAPPEEPARDKRKLAGDHPFDGATVLNLSPRVAQELDLPLEKTGVVVEAVGDRSYAARFGLRPRDIVVSLNGSPVSSTRELQADVERARSWRFEIERDGQRLTQVVR